MKVGELLLPHFHCKRFGELTRIVTRFVFSSYFIIARTMHIQQSRYSIPRFLFLHPYSN